jgi:hypothetical protein
MAESEASSSPETEEASMETPDVPETSAPEQGGSPTPSAAATAAPDEKVVVCDFCGPLKGPKAQVFQCTLCTKSYCVQHADPFFHACPPYNQS